MTPEDVQRSIKVSHRELMQIDAEFQAAIRPLMEMKASIMSRAMPKFIRLFGSEVPVQYEYSEEVKAMLAVCDHAIEEMIVLYKKKAQQ